MSFVQSGFLIACAAAAIPLLVHLLSRWQVRSLELGTMRFLQEVIHDRARRRKIRRWLLLMTRVALVTLLALLFARPFLPERTQRGGDRLRIVLVDRSASMGMPGKNGRLVDDALRAASASIASLGSEARALLAWFDSGVEPLADAARPSAPRAVVGDTDYLAALSWARDRVHAHPDKAADVVLVTDLQQSGLASERIATDSLRFPPDVPVQIVDVGRPVANNLAITRASVPATRVAHRRDTTVAATLFNYGTTPFEQVPMTASAFDGNRTVRLKQTVDVPAGQAEELSFDFGRLEPGTWRVTIALDVDDDLAADNRRLTAVQVAEPVKVVVFDPGSREDGAAASSYYLIAALEPDEPRDDEEGSLEIQPTAGVDAELDQPPLSSRFQPEVVYLQEDAVRVLDPETRPLAVVADAGALAPRAIAQLEQYVRRGGKLLVFAGEGWSGEAAVRWQQSRLAPGAFGVPQQSGAMPFRIARVSGRGAMLAPFEDPQHGDLSRLRFQKLLPVAANDATEVLAWFDSRRPALTQHRLGSGRVVWFLSSADAAWGSWTMSPLYLPLVQQMASDLVNLTGEGPIRFRGLGDQQPPPRDLAAAVGEVTQARFSETPPASGLSFSRPGYFPRDEALYVVNGAEKESDPSRVEPAAFAEHFALTLAGAADPAVGERSESERRNELWPWLAAAVLVLCVGEFTLANRTSA